jgi:hypothetical protein
MPLVEIEKDPVRFGARTTGNVALGMIVPAAASFPGRRKGPSA